MHRKERGGETNCSGNMISQSNEKRNNNTTTYMYIDLGRICWSCRYKMYRNQKPTDQSGGGRRFVARLEPRSSASSARRQAHVRRQDALPKGSTCRQKGHARRTILFLLVLCDFAGARFLVPSVGQPYVQCDVLILNCKMRDRYLR